MSEQEREAFERNNPAPKNVEWSEELGRYKTKFLHGLPPTMGGIYQARWEGWQSRAQAQVPDITPGILSAVKFLEDKETEFSLAHAYQEADTGAWVFNTDDAQGYAAALMDIADDLRGLLQSAPRQPVTPAARWRENGKTDPHGTAYDCERSRLCLGDLSDDEIANEVFLHPSITNLTAAKERIRWLSRRLIETQQPSDSLPAFDPSRSREEQGLYGKFYVRRVDGTDQPGGKHHGCRYFVLDVDHDQFAPAALDAYAAKCEHKYPELARDLREKFGAQQPAYQEPVAFIFPDDLERLETTEYASTAHSVEMSHPERGKTTIPLYLKPPAPEGE